MKVATTPLTFEGGEILDPRDLNEVFNYAADAVQSTAEKRYIEAVFPLSFVKDAGSGYTQADSAEVRSFRFTPKNTCYITRGYLYANLTSNDAVNVVIEEASGGATPSGATDPWLTTSEGSASASTEITDFNADRVLLAAGTEYVFRVESAGNFTIERFDVVMHLLVDRWTPAGTADVPNFEPTLLDESDNADATTVSTNVTNLGTETAKFASKDSAPVPVLYAVHDFTSATDADLLTFYLPRFDSSRASARIVRIDLFVAMSSAGGAGETVSANVYNDTGVFQDGATASIDGVTEASDSADVNIALTEATSSISATQSEDYYLYIFSTSATTCSKAYAIVWFDFE